MLEENKSVLDESLSGGSEEARDVFEVNELALSVFDEQDDESVEEERILVAGSRVMGLSVVRGEGLGDVLSGSDGGPENGVLELTRGRA